LKNFFRDLGYSIKTFFQGRYGSDMLSWTLIIAGLIISMGSGYVKAEVVSKILTIMSFAMICFALYRTYSKNIEARQKELAAFKHAFSGPINSIKMISLKKKDPEHLYVKCPNCKTILRVPKGKGRIIITCPKCQNKVELKS